VNTPSPLFLLQRIEQLGPKEKRQALQFLDALIEHELR